MARLARVVAAGLPHHVTQRGNRRQPVFFSEGDYAAYLAMLAEGCRAAGTAGAGQRPAHRAHASTVGVTRFLPERAAGFLMIRELEALHAVMDNPARPAVAALSARSAASVQVSPIRRDFSATLTCARSAIHRR